MNSIIEIAQAVYQLLDQDECKHFSDGERGIQQMLKQVGQISLEEWAKDHHNEEPLTEWKGEAVRYEGSRPARVMSIYGWVPYERAYYRYKDQRGGVSPFDEEWGLRPNAMSAEVERLAALYGVELPFEKASQLLEETLLLTLSDHSLDKATQQYGQEVDQLEAEWTEVAVNGGRPTDEPPPRRLYGTLDETSVHIREGKTTGLA